MSELHRWAEGIWYAEAPQRFFGVPLGTRMTVVKTGDDSLLLHSPIALTPALRTEIDALGVVRDVVSPNKLHHLHLQLAKDAYPDSRLHAPPGLAAKRPDLRFDSELGDAAPPAWAGRLGQRVVRGSWMMEEVVFFEPASRTLLVGDLCEHFGRWSPRPTRLVARIGRMYERPRMPPDWQLTFRDRAARRASFEQLFAWDFDRVLLAHGAPIESGAKALLRKQYAWALA